MRSRNFSLSARQNFNLLYFQPANFSSAIGDLNPIIMLVQNRKLRAIVNSKRVLRIVKWATFGDCIVRNDNGALF